MPIHLLPRHAEEQRPGPSFSAVIGKVGHLHRPVADDPGPHNLRGKLIQPSSVPESRSGVGCPCPYSGATPRYGSANAAILPKRRRRHRPPVDVPLRLIDDHRRQQLRVLRRREADERGHVFAFPSTPRFPPPARSRSCRPACTPARSPPRRCRPPPAPLRAFPAPAPPPPALITRCPCGSWISFFADPLDQLRLPEDAAVGDRRVAGDHLHRRHRLALADRQVAHRGARVFVELRHDARFPRRGTGPRSCGRSRSG